MNYKLINQEKTQALVMIFLMQLRKQLEALCLVQVKFKGFLTKKKILYLYHHHLRIKLIQSKKLSYKLETNRNKQFILVLHCLYSISLNLGCHLTYQETLLFSFLKSTSQRSRALTYYLAISSKCSKTKFIRLQAKTDIKYLY